MSTMYYDNIFNAVIAGLKQAEPIGGSQDGTGVEKLDWDDDRSFWLKIYETPEGHLYYQCGIYEVDDAQGTTPFDAMQFGIWRRWEAYFLEDITDDYIHRYKANGFLEIPEWFERGSELVELMPKSLRADYYQFKSKKERQAITGAIDKHLKDGWCPGGDEAGFSRGDQGETGQTPQERRRRKM